MPVRSHHLARGWCHTGALGGQRRRCHTARRLEQHCPGHWREPHRPSPSLALRGTRGPERWRDFLVSHSKEAAKRALVPGLPVRAACQACPPAAGARACPFSQRQGGMASGKAIQVSAQSRCGGQPGGEEPERLQRPLLCPVAPSREPECFISIPQHAPRRRPAGCLALQGLFIYMGAEGIGSLSASPRMLSWGASQLPPGARVGQTWQENRSGRDQGSAAPCSEACSGFWPEPGNGLGAPCLVGEQGCRLLGDGSLGSDSGRCWGDAG